jgi:hypothetical protein
VATAILEVKQTNLLWEKDSSSSPLCFKVWTRYPGVARNGMGP